MTFSVVKEKVHLGHNHLGHNGVTFSMVKEMEYRWI